MAAVSAFLDWLTKQDSPALGALIAAGIGGFVAFVVAVVNAVAARLLERARAHRQFRAEGIAPVQRLANTLVQVAHIALKTPSTAAGDGPQPMPPEMAKLVGEAEAFFLPTGFPRDRVDYFTKFGTDFARHVGRFRSNQNPSQIELKLIEAHLGVVELAASDLLLRCEVFVFGGLLLRLRSLRRHYWTTARAVAKYNELAAEGQ